MLTSFFRKSKPINYLAVGLLLLYYFLFARFSEVNIEWETMRILKSVGAFFVFLLLIFILNNLTKRNEITQRSSYTILLFVIFTGFFPAVLFDFKTVLVGFIVVLALRRAIGLRNKKDRKKKFADISIWLTCVFFIFESAFPFLVIPFLAIILYEAENPKNYLIPLIASGAVALLAISVSLIFDHTFFGLYHFNFSLNYDFSAYRSQGLILPLGVILAFNIWLFVHFFKVTQKAKRKNKASLYLIFWFWAASILTVLFTSEKNASELIFFILPLSIAGSLYLQQKKELVFKELMLITLLVISLALPFFI